METSKTLSIQKNTLTNLKRGTEIYQKTELTLTMINPEKLYASLLDNVNLCIVMHCKYLCKLIQPYCEVLPHLVSFQTLQL